jgi:uncharacterized membrane protein
VKSNNNSKIPARLYLDAVENLKGCPRVYGRIAAPRMLLLLGCSLILEQMEMMNLQAQKHTSMGHRQQTNV